MRKGESRYLEEETVLPTRVSHFLSTVLRDEGVGWLWRGMKKGCVIL